MLQQLLEATAAAPRPEDWGLNESKLHTNTKAFECTIARRQQWPSNNPIEDKVENEVHLVFHSEYFRIGSKTD